MRVLSVVGNRPQFINGVDLSRTPLGASSEEDVSVLGCGRCIDVAAAVPETRPAIHDIAFERLYRRYVKDVYMFPLLQTSGEARTLRRGNTGRRLHRIAASEARLHPGVRPGRARRSPHVYQAIK